MQLFMTFHSSESGFQPVMVRHAVVYKEVLNMPKANKVLVLFRMDDEQKARLEAINPDADYTYESPDSVTKERVDEADVILGSVAPAAVASSKNLKWLQLWSAGTDAFQKSGDFPEGAILTNGSGGYGLTISEHTIAMIIMLKRKLYLHYLDQLEGKWGKGVGEISSIYGSRILIIGLGDLGKEFAKKAKALGAYIIGVRRTQGLKPDFVDEVHTVDKLDELLCRADIVTLSVPDTKESRNILNKGRIAKLKSDAIVINVGRGSAIDTEAITEALESGQIGGAALDVTDPEPLPADHKLWKLPNVLITPHASGNHNLPETYRRLKEIAIENYKAYTTDGQMRNVVDFNRQY